MPVEVSMGTEGLDLSIFQGELDALSVAGADSLAGDRLGVFNLSIEVRLDLHQDASKTEPILSWTALLWGS